MKKILIMLSAILMTLSCTVNNNTDATYEKEVEKEATTVVDNLVEYTMQKDIDQLMSLFSDSKEFQIIDNEGIPRNYEDLREFYTNFFEILEDLKLLESNIKVLPIDADNAYCIWQGKEEIKIKNTDSKFSSWIATIIIKKINGSWKITLFHATHY